MSEFLENQKRVGLDVPLEELLNDANEKILETWNFSVKKDFHEKAEELMNDIGRALDMNRVACRAFEYAGKKTIPVKAFIYHAATVLQVFFSSRKKLDYLQDFAEKNSYVDNHNTPKISLILIGLAAEAEANALNDKIIERKRVEEEYILTIKDDKTIELLS